MRSSRKSLGIMWVTTIRFFIKLVNTCVVMGSPTELHGRLVHQSTESALYALEVYRSLSIGLQQAAYLEYCLVDALKSDSGI